MGGVSIRETLIVLVLIVVVGLATVIVLSNDGGPATRWRVELGASVSAGPLLDGGVVYAASEEGIVVALDAATGDERWRNALDETPRGLIRTDGEQIYLRTDEGDVFALDAATGATVWRARFEGGVNVPVLAEGALVVATRRGDIVALDVATGDERWRTESGRTLRADPALTGSSGDIVAVGDIGGRLHRFDLGTGERIGEETVLGREFHGPPLQVGDVTVVASTPDLVAIDSDGAEVWRTAINEANRVQIVERGGVLYVDATPDLLAVDLATGAIRWRYTSPALVVTFGVGEDLAIAGMHTGEVHGIDLKTGERVWRYRTNESVRGAPVIDDVAGLAYFGGLDGSVYAIVIREDEGE